MELHKRPIRQIAYYTDDIEAAALRHSNAFGSGPFLVQRASCKGMDRGKPVDFESRFCVGQWGELVVEFISDTSVPTVMNCLPLEGKRQRMHHVALIVDDFDAEIARLEAAGYPVAHLSTPVEMPEFRFAFLDALHDLGMFIEVYQGAFVEQGYQDLKQMALAWDGNDPVRIV